MIFRIPRARPLRKLIVSRIEKAWQRTIFALRGGNRLNGCEDEFSLRAFHLALTTFLLWDAVMDLAMVPLFAVQKVLGGSILLLVGVMAGVALLLLRRFHKRSAAALFLTTMWCCMEVYSTFSGGVRGGGGYLSVVIVIAAAWLIGVGSAIGFVSMTLAISFAEAAFEASGHHLPVYFHGPPFALWVGQTGLIALTIGPILAFPKALRTQIAALRDSEERFRSLSDASVEAIMIHDGKAILNCNLALARMFGYERPEELIGRDPVDTLVSARSQPQIRKRMAGTETAPAEVTCVRQDGSEFPVETGSRVMKYQGRDARLVSCRDLSDRNRAIEAMRESEERYRALFDRSLDCVFLADFEGRVLDANQAWMDLLGYRREDFQNLTVQSLLTAEQLPIVQERVGRMLGQGMQKRPQEYQMRRRDGGEVFIEMHSSLLYRNGEPVAILAIGRNVTERKRVEAEKTKLEKQLFEAQKMESIGRLAGGVAHDFNNLLTVINGYSKILINHLESGQRRYAEQINKAGESAASLTRQLLAFSRMEVTRAQPVLLNEVVAESREMLGRMAGEDIEMRTMLNASPDQVLADPNQIHQCLMNLVVNGRDAMPAGGRLTIETGNVQIGQKDLPAGSDAEPGPHVCLTVRDTGVGMNEETSRRIFEPFFTTKEKGRGTGLGLSTVYGIVSQWRGFIKVASEPEKGAEFSIYLPLCVMTSARTGDAAMKGATPAPPSETLLVVEDQDIVREFVVESLRANGYAVLEARNGREALRILEEQRPAIHLLMTDVLMPGMGGRALAAQAHLLCPSMKVLFMTGYADGAVDDIDGRDGREEVIMKPFSPEALEARVHSLLHPAKSVAEEAEF